MTEYDVFRVDDEDNRLDRVGRVGLDDVMRMQVIDGDDADLLEAVEELNGEEALTWKHAGTDEGEGKGAIAKTSIARGAPDFLVALQDNLRRWHALELDLPTAPEDERDAA